ncbi:MAG: hypothetical protein FGM16_09420 [Flavobacterium sp.]|nr:hypothetical protein [Flavobacterium sp.]
MKNNFFIFFTFLILTLTLFSCNVTSYTNRNISIDKNDLITNNVVVDVKVEHAKIVTATSGVRESIELAKNEAYYKVITEKNIDIVVDPIFEISTIGTKYTVKVTGFAGYYTNPRSKIDAVKEFKAVKAENINAFDKMYNLEPILDEKSSVQTEAKSKVVLPFGLQSFKPVHSNSGPVKKFDFLVFSSQNQFSYEYDAGSDEFENNGYAFALAYDFNPAKKISLKSELMYGINKDYDHLTKSLYLRCKLFKNFNLIAGPSILYFITNDNLKEFNFGYTSGAAYNVGNKIAIEVKSSYYSNVINESFLSNSSYLSLNFGLGYKF